MEQEIKSKLDELGKTWGEFQDSHKILKAEMAELGKKDGVLEESVKKASEAVASLHEELTKKFDDVSTKLNRLAVDVPAETEEGKKATEDLRLFCRTSLALTGQLKSDQEVPAAAIEDAKKYNKLLPSYLRRGTRQMEDEIKALSVGSDIDGGMFVRPQWSARIITKIFESSPFRQYATVETVSGPELKYPVDIGEADCGWVAETGARSATATPPIQEKSIIAHEMYALPKATQTILEDAGIDVEGWLMGKVGEKFARTEATAFVTGTGTGKPRGLLTYPDGLNWGQVQQYGSGSSGAFTLTGLTNLVAQLKEEYHPNARFFFRREAIPSIMLLQDGDGRYVFQPIFSMGYNQAPLLGYPITYAHDMPTIAAGAKVGIFGDIKTAYTIVDRLGITMLRDPYVYKPFVGFYTRKRVGGDVLNFEAYKIFVLT